MATIKRKANGKIILKDGKVSCECCGECCMYPAQELVDGLYSENDLPDQIRIFYCSIPGSSILSSIAERSGKSFIGPNVSVKLSNNVWLVGAYDNLIETDFDCLIGSLNFDGDLICTETFKSFGIQHLFADAYTATGIVNDISVTETVVRESICVWRGSLLTLSNLGYKWRLNGKAKIGFQNDPVGNYEDGFEVE